MSDVPHTDESLAAILVNGPQPVVVELAEYDPDWPARYLRRAAALRAALGDRVRRLEHVGSTSVPGLAAKPVIDIVLGVADPDDEPAYLPALHALGYVDRVREPGHRCLRGDGSDGPANLHCRRFDDPEIDRNLTFRDRLRAHPEDRRRYEAVKRGLAGRQWADMNYYAQAKGPVIREIETRAGWTHRD